MALTQRRFSLAILICGASAQDCLRQCQACLEHCQKLEHMAGLPMVVIGRGDSTGIKTRAREAGATDYIRWPVEPAELLARVKAVLRANVTAPGQESRRAMAPGIDLDMNRQVIIVQGQEKHYNRDGSFRQPIGPKDISAREERIFNGWPGPNPKGSFEGSKWMNHCMEIIHQTLE